MTGTPAGRGVLAGQAAVDGLLFLLDITPVGEAPGGGAPGREAPGREAPGGELRFRGMSPPGGPQRVYGGLVAAQALVAAGRTVDETRAVHSLHAYFVRPGDPGAPITYAVERVRDGRSFSVRRCTAYQHGKPIFLMSASFHRYEEGLDHGEPAPVVGVDVPPPDEVPTMVERLAEYPESLAFWADLPRPLDVRYVGEPGWVPPGTRPAARSQRVWMRVDGKLPDDPLLHACALTFASDLTLLDTVLGVHGAVWGPGGYTGASLDHVLWFHRPMRADEWFLYDCWSPSASGARGLAAARMFSLDGRHLASAMQEGMLRREP